MIQTLLGAAHEGGGEVIIHLRSEDGAYRGVIQTFNETGFTLFQIGQTHNLLWAFHHEDVLSCALVVPTPADHDLLEEEAPSQEEPNHGGSVGTLQRPLPPSDPSF